mmetsp:Transcript_59862/g.135314  ORF Transcript_59862/g.135314 Transcript_59862/m.135314 type:complete len:211 (-) Transcript_59862:2-634(-)
MARCGQSTLLSGCGYSSEPQGESSTTPLSSPRPARSNSKSTHSLASRQEAGREASKAISCSFSSAASTSGVPGVPAASSSVFSPAPSSALSVSPRSASAASMALALPSAPSAGLPSAAAALPSPPSVPSLAAAAKGRRRPNAEKAEGGRTAAQAGRAAMGATVGALPGKDETKRPGTRRAAPEGRATRAKAEAMALRAALISRGPHKLDA